MHQAPCGELFYQRVTMRKAVIAAAVTLLTLIAAVYLRLTAVDMLAKRNTCLCPLNRTRII